MANFTFQFESILKIKIQFEKSIKNEFGKAMALLNQEKENLNHLEKKREMTIQEMNGTSKKTMVKSLKEYSQYLGSLKEKINHQKDIVNQHQKNVDKIRVRLIEAVKEREIFEKLKEKKLEEYLKEEQKKEQKQADEIVSYKINIRENGDGG